MSVFPQMFNFSLKADKAMFTSLTTKYIIQIKYDRNTEITRLKYSLNLKKQKFDLEDLGHTRMHTQSFYGL